jgi:LysR family glycine cleavage system transcriptional activator
MERLELHTAMMPPLNALKAFEVAARHLNFTRAADELCVTQGAVSRHVMALEDRLGVKLFVRDRRRLRLTQEGEDYADAVRRAFRIITENTAALVARRNTDVVQIAATPTFSVRWLMPRLASFYARHPRTEVMVRVSNNAAGLTDFADTNVDLGIEYVEDGSPLPGEGYSRATLFKERTSIVCHPQLVSGLAPPRDLSDILGYVLLTSIRRPRDWDFFLDASGIGSVEHDREIHLGNSTLVYQGVRDGLGLAVVPLRFVEDDLRLGNLIRPFDLDHATGHSYVITVAPDRSRRAPVQAFRDWILSEAGAERDEQKAAGQGQRMDALRSRKRLMAAAGRPDFMVERKP